MRWWAFDGARMILLLAAGATMGHHEATPAATAGATAESLRQSNAKGVHHYFDDSGGPLPQWDLIWTQLAAYFGSSVPDRIILRHGDGGTSRFSPQEYAITIGPGQDSVGTVAHESAHLCMFNLTNGASVASSFRFFDEGFASIIGHRIAGYADSYRQYALFVAQQESLKGNVTLAKVQDWSTYFGAPGSNASTRNWRAYRVGSSLLYMIEDTRGADALKAFFVDIGKTKDLAATFQNVFSITPSALEREWQDYLNRVELDMTPPSVVAMSPPHLMSGVPTDRREIVVAFSAPMFPRVCVVTPCGDTGVCYTNAYWRDDRTLAIKVEGTLKHGYSYQLVLGNQKQDCRLRSRTGAELPFTEWHFTAAD